MALYREATITLHTITGYSQMVGYPVVFYPSGTVGSGPGYIYRALAGGPTSDGTVVTVRSQESDPAWWPGKDGVMDCRGDVAGDKAYPGGSGVHTAHAEAVTVDYASPPFLSLGWEGPTPGTPNVVSATKIRLPFSGLIQTSGVVSYTVELEDEFVNAAHYAVINTDTSASLGVLSVTLVNSTEIEITLATPMVNDVLYQLSSATSLYARGTGIVVGGSGFHYPTASGNYQSIFFTPTGLEEGPEEPPPEEPEEPEDLPDDAGPGLSPFAIALGVAQGRIAEGDEYVIELGHAQRIKERFAEWDRHRLTQSVPVEAGTRVVRTRVRLRAPRSGDTTPTIAGHNGFIFRAGVGTTVYYRRPIYPDGRSMWILDVALPVTNVSGGHLPVFYELLLSYGTEEPEA